MDDDPKTIAGFLATIKPILKRYDMEVEIELSIEKHLEFHLIDLYNLQHGDYVYIHSFIKTEGRTLEGYSCANFLNNEFILDFVNLDSVFPPIERTREGDMDYKKLEDLMKALVPILIESLNNYLKS